MVKSNEMRIRFRSFQSEKCEKIRSDLKIFAEKKNLYFSFINLPIKKKKITVLRSPHVNKRARDQYEVNVFNCFVFLRGCFLVKEVYWELQRIISKGCSARLVFSEGQK